MTPPVFAQCVAGQCGSISPATPPEKIALAMGLVLLGVFVIAAIVAMLHTAERKHQLFHFFLPSSFCSRCLTEQNAKADDRAFNRSSSHSKLTQSVEAPR